METVVRPPVSVSCKRRVTAGARTLSGFTLVELLAAITIVAILAAMGVPAMRSMIEGNAVNSQANAFIGALGLARAEAIKHATRIIMCSSEDADTAATPACTGQSHWETGWIVFLDHDGDGAYGAQAGDLLLQVQGAFSNSGGISETGSNVASLDFYPTGLLRSGAGSYRFQPASGTASLQRCVVISLTGYAQLTGSGACP